VGLTDRFAAVVLCLGLVAGNAAVCAGWAATPEARMACCEDENCPMHKGDSRDTGSTRVLTQAQADACCAWSEREESRSSTPTSLPAISFAVLGHGVVLPATVPALVLSDDWRTAAPTPTAPVPRHVLLSVFLV
jgi:hypothetical protein